MCSMLAVDMLCKYMSIATIGHMFMSIKTAKQDMRQRDSYIAGEVSPSRAYGPPLVAVMPGGEGPTDQV
jgi:hypothetical protein